MKTKLFFTTKALRFKCFSHKAYAAFASMHRQISIGRVCRAICDKELLKSGIAVISSAALCFISVLSAWADDSDALPDEVSQLTLQEVEVLCMMPKSDFEAYRLVAEIDKSAIAAIPATSVADVLATLPGLDIRTRGANGAQADVSMRGGTFDQVLICLNGVPISDAQTGHYALNLPVPLSTIERIEIFQGATTSLFGGSAFTGAINIVTLRPDSNTYHADLSLGMNRFAKAQLTGGWYRKGWSIVVSTDYSHANGYYAPSPSEKEQISLKNSDFDIANVFSSLYFDKGLHIQLGAQYKNAGAGMFYGFGSQDQFDATRTGFVSIRYSHTWTNLTLETQAAYRANYDHYQWHRGTDLYGNRHLAQNANASIRIHYDSRVGKTTFGIDVRNENILSTNLGDSIKKQHFPLGANRVNVSYFAKQTFQTHGFSASLEASGIYNTSFGHHWTAGVDLGYSFRCGLSVYANANHAVRMPTFTDLYYNAGNQLGSRTLQPEKAVTASIGSEYQKSWGKAGTLSARADVYYRWGRDIMDWVYVPEDTKRPFHAMNQQRVNTLGIETSLSYRWNTWLRLIQLSYAYTNLTIDSNSKRNASRYLDPLRHKLVFRLEHGIYKGLAASWTLTYRDRDGQYNNAEGTVCDYKPVLLFDGEIYYDLKHWRFAIACTNITNRHYYDYGGILQPGAWAKGTITYHL